MRTIQGTALWDERRRFWWKPWTWFRKNVEGMPWVVQTKRFTKDQIEAKWGGYHATHVIRDEPFRHDD